jgi:hypothetical protein
MAPAFFDTMIVMPTRKQMEREIAATRTEAPRVDGSKKLVVKYDVTGLPRGAVGALELEAVAQGEASDGEGGKHYDGESGHPDVPVLGARITRRGKKATLIVEFDVTKLSQREVDFLDSEVAVQAESSDDHPDVGVTTEVVAG